MTTEIIGKEIQAQRKRLGMNQTELAMVSGTGVRFISDLENGKASCEFGKVLAVLQNVGLEIEIQRKGT